MNLACDLCPNIIYKVLKRALMETETIGRCRFLSKKCNQLTYEFTFAKLQSQETNTISSIFIQSMIKMNIMLPLFQSTL